MKNNFYSMCGIVLFFGLLARAVQAEGDFTWITKAPMQQSRSDFASVVLGGKIYAMGGYVGGFTRTASVEAYDPVSDTWSSKASISNAVSGLRAAVANEKIYVFGGALTGGPCISAAEEYDPLTNTWNTKSPMSEGKYRMAVGVLNNKIYIAGGSFYSSVNGWVATNKVEEYDPLTDTWTIKTPMPVLRHPKYSTTTGSKIYCFGEPSYVYDMATDTWSEKVGPPVDNIGLPATAEMNGKIYTFGGALVWTSNGPVSIPDVCEYDPATDIWFSKAPLITAVAHGPAASVICNKVYVLGGQTTFTVQSTTLVQQGTYESNPIQEILDFIEESVADGTLAGSGPGKSAQGRLGALINMIETAGDLIEANDPNLLEDTCGQLHAALAKTDGQDPPPDFVTGPAAPQLAAMIEELMDSLECE
jgi:N-acetylneuraminic acid mutarotase